jgi:hypothetical protein
MNYEWRFEKEIDVQKTFEALGRAVLLRQKTKKLKVHVWEKNSWRVEARSESGWQCTLRKSPLEKTLLVLCGLTLVLGAIIFFTVRLTILLENPWFLLLVIFTALIFSGRRSICVSSDRHRLVAIGWFSSKELDLLQSTVVFFQNKET